MSRKGKSIETESRCCQGWGEEAMGSYCLRGTKFLSGVMKRFWKYWWWLHSLVKLINATGLSTSTLLKWQFLWHIFCHNKKSPCLTTSFWSHWLTPLTLVCSARGSLHRCLFCTWSLGALRSHGLNTIFTLTASRFLSPGRTFPELWPPPTTWLIQRESNTSRTELLLLPPHKSAPSREQQLWLST